MVKKVIWTPQAEQTFETVLDYLEMEWSEKEKVNFVKATDKIIQLISRQPYLFRRVSKPGFREALVTKHNLLLYKIKENSIDLITFWDTRKDPKKKALKRKTA